MTMRRTTQAGGKPRKDIFLYNMSQAQFFLDHGLCPIGISRGNQGDVYVKFEHTEAAEEVWQKWNAHVERMKSIQG